MEEIEEIAEEPAAPRPRAGRGTGRRTRGGRAGAGRGRAAGRASRGGTGVRRRGAAGAAGRRRGAGGGEDEEEGARYAPPPKSNTPVIIGVIAAVVIIGVVGFLMMGGDDPAPTPNPADQANNANEGPDIQAGGGGAGSDIEDRAMEAVNGGQDVSKQEANEDDPYAPTPEPEDKPLTDDEIKQQKSDELVENRPEWGDVPKELASGFQTGCWLMELDDATLKAWTEYLDKDVLKETENILKDGGSASRQMILDDMGKYGGCVIELVYRDDEELVKAAASALEAMMAQLGVTNQDMSAVTYPPKVINPREGRGMLYGQMVTWWLKNKDKDMITGGGEGGGGGMDISPFLPGIRRGGPDRESAIGQMRPYAPGIYGTLISHMNDEDFLLTKSLIITLEIMTGESFGKPEAGNFKDVKKQWEDWWANR
jgi:hypothetical protein